MTREAKIVYTKTDEAPALATYSFLPIVKAFCAAADIEVEKRDISLAARIISQFGSFLEPEQSVCLMIWTTWENWLINQRPISSNCPISVLLFHN